nr:integrase, catalytic region, zinc finger, CCHC-type, peptidase aspartic, catalytic [Tanacetum cinerariifolium]
MTGNLKLLCNFVEKFMGTIHFSNDQFAPIISYGDLVQGNVTINRVYYVEGLNHNLFSVGQFCDADLEVAFKKSTCFVKDLQGNDLLIAIATACYTQNQSIIIPNHGKTPYHIINDRKTSIKHLHIFGCICYITRDGKNLDKMKEKGDPCILVGYSTQSKGYRVYNKRTRMIVESIHIRFEEIKEVSETSVANNTSGLVPQRQKASDYDNHDPVTQRQDVSSSADEHVPLQQELDLLFGSNPQDKQPLTNIPSTSVPSTPTYVHVEENTNDQAEEGEHVQDDKFTNPFYAPAQEEAESSSHNIGNSNVPTFNQRQVFEYRWTKDHPLEQVRGNPSRLVQIRRQLAIDPEMCMYALTVSTTKPKNIMEAMANSAWIEAMQEELHQFDRLRVWELVDKPFGKMVIKLKWLWKNKKDKD